MSLQRIKKEYDGNRYYHIISVWCISNISSIRKLLSCSLVLNKKPNNTPFSQLSKIGIFTTGSNLRFRWHQFYSCKLFPNVHVFSVRNQNSRVDRRCLLESFVVDVGCDAWTDSVPMKRKESVSLPHLAKHQQQRGCSRYSFWTKIFRCRILHLRKDIFKLVKREGIRR